MRSVRRKAPFREGRQSLVYRFDQRNLCQRCESTSNTTVALRSDATHPRPSEPPSGGLVSSRRGIRRRQGPVADGRGEVVAVRGVEASCGTGRRRSTRCNRHRARAVVHGLPAARCLARKRGSSELSVGARPEGTVMRAGIRIRSRADRRGLRYESDLTTHVFN